MKYKLVDLIEQIDRRNTKGQFGLSSVKGISIQKVFIETKANMDGVSLTPYKLVEPNTFAYVTVTSRNGEKITLAYNNSTNTYIVSSSYIVFKVKKPNLLSSEFLFMYFNRPEFDRFSRYNSWGSARETFHGTICVISKLTYLPSRFKKSMFQYINPCLTIKRHMKMGWKI